MINEKLFINKSNLECVIHMLLNAIIKDNKGFFYHYRSYCYSDTSKNIDVMNIYIYTVIRITVVICMPRLVLLTHTTIHLLSKFQHYILISSSIDIHVCQTVKAIAKRSSNETSRRLFFSSNEIGKEKRNFVHKTKEK